MPIKSYRPTTPTRRFQTVVSREDITKQTEKSLVQPKKHRGRNSTGRRDVALHRRRRQEGLSRVDFKRDKSGIPACRGYRIRSQPRQLHRAVELCRRREALHPAARRAEGGDEDHERGDGRHSDRQRAPVEEHPGRHDRAQHRAEARQGRHDGAPRRVRRRSWFRAKAAGAAETALRRNPPGSGGCMATVGQVGTWTENVSLARRTKRWMGKTPHNRGVS